jgi:hypothetical protein
MTGRGPLYLYTREGCHLCERFLLDLALDFPAVARSVAMRDIDTQAAWATAYGLRIPVLTADDDEVLCEGAYDRARVEAALGL